MTVYLVVGPPGVGKSTVSRLMAGVLARSVLVDVDRIRDTMVVNGRCPAGHRVARVPGAAAGGGP